MSDKAKFFDDLQRKYELGFEKVAKNITVNIKDFLSKGPYSVEEVERWLTGLGVQGYAQYVSGSYDGVIEYTKLVSAASDIPLVLPENTETILGLYKENQMQHILKASDEITKTIADASLRYGIGEQKISDIIRDLEGTIKTAGRRIVTEAYTGANIYDRTVKYMQFTNANVELYFYDGPLDSHTREVCQNTLSDPRQATGWRLIDVQSSQTPFSTCGGYNCRHEWLPFVPGLQEEIDAMAREANAPEIQVGEQ